jgi:hypothetical protein
LKEFSDFAALSDSALVFYAGNGINLEGAPILLPIGARTDTVKHAADDGISFKKLLANLHAPRAYRVIVLDACRKNELLDDGKASCITSVDEIPNTTITSAFEGSGKGENGSGIATAIVKFLGDPALDIPTLLIKTGEEVSNATKKKYWVTSSGGPAQKQNYYFLNDERFDQAATGLSSDAIAWARTSKVDRKALEAFAALYPDSPLRNEAKQAALCLRVDSDLVQAFFDTITQPFDDALTQLERAHEAIESTCKNKLRFVAGSVKKVIPCYNNAYYIETEKGGFVWSERSRSKDWGQSIKAGQEVIALPGVDYHCVESTNPLKVFNAVHLNGLRIRDRTR